MTDHEKRDSYSNNIFFPDVNTCYFTYQQINFEQIISKSHDI